MAVLFQWPSLLNWVASFGAVMGLEVGGRELNAKYKVIAQR